MKYIFILIMIFLLSASDTLADDFDRLTALNNAKSWMYQIQDLYNDGAITTLATTDYPLLVLEPTYTIKGEKKFDVEGMLNALRYTPSNKRRLLIAYIDIGQAEDYRYYWKKTWRAPTAKRVGQPKFLVGIDPDGWSGNYPVAFWKKKWQRIWLGKKKQIRKLAKFGFDGVYLDWIEAYDDENVIKAAPKRMKLAKKMRQFIGKIRKQGRKVVSDFLVIAQNAPYLLDESSTEYCNVIDAAAFEDTWFMGDGDSEWGDPKGGDIPNSYEDDYKTSALIEQYKKYQQQCAIPVFTIDYCLQSANATYVYQQSQSHGFSPLVSQVALSRLTETPPQT